MEDEGLRTMNEIIRRRGVLLDQPLSRIRARRLFEIRSATPERGQRADEVMRELGYRDEQVSNLGCRIAI